MDWFERLERNRYIEMVMVTDNQGHLLRSSRALGSDDELLPSMIQAFEALAQTLTAEFDCGDARMVQVSTEQGHLLVFPLIESLYYVAVLTQRAAPLMLITVELERTLRGLGHADLMLLEQSSGLSDELDAEELIEAVEDWLRRRPLDRI
jgi:predicted regulator of Ras-like GTPase activity (Roadblock/LC7/MglB family)